MEQYLLGFPDMGMDGKFETTVSIIPQKSQVFTTGCLILSGLSLLSGFAFLWTEKDSWVVPIAVAAVSGAVGLLCWLLSHRNTDLSGGRATQLTADSNGMNLTFDARNQPSKQMLLIFSAYAESAAYRERLPHSNGLIDESGKVVENSEVIANVEIDQLNKFVAEQSEQLERLIGEIKVDGEAGLGSGVAAPSYTGDEPVEGMVLEASK